MWLLYSTWDQLQLSLSASLTNLSTFPSNASKKTHLSTGQRNASHLKKIPVSLRTNTRGMGLRSDVVTGSLSSEPTVAQISINSSSQWANSSTKNSRRNLSKASVQNKKSRTFFLCAMLCFFSKPSKRRNCVSWTSVFVALTRLSQPISITV